MTSPVSLGHPAFANLSPVATFTLFVLFTVTFLAAVFILAALLFRVSHFVIPLVAFYLIALACYVLRDNPAVCDTLTTVIRSVDSTFPKVKM